MRQNICPGCYAFDLTEMAEVNFQFWKWLGIRLSWRNSNKRVTLSFKLHGSNSAAVPKLFGCWAKFATLVSAGQTALCIEKNKTKIHMHNIGHVCTLHFFFKCNGYTLRPGADTGGDARDASPPTRPKEVLTWHLISLKSIAKMLWYCTLLAKDAKI